MNKKIIIFFKQNIFLLIVITIIAYIYRGWFNSGYITAGDWRAWDIDSMKEWFSVFSTWENKEYGGFYTIENVYIIRNPIRLLYGILAKLGIGFDISGKILNNILFLVLGFTGMYKLSKYLFRDKFASIVATSYFILNNYIFHYAYIGHISSMIVPYALIPWIFYFFIKNIYCKGYKNLIFLIIAFNISLYYDTRITYLTCILLCIWCIFYTLKDKKIKRNIYRIISKNIIFALSTIIINIFWIMPIIKYPFRLVDPETFGLVIQKNTTAFDAILNTHSYFREHYTYGSLFIISAITIFGLFCVTAKNIQNKINIKLFLYSTLVIMIFFAIGGDTFIPGETSFFKDLFEYIFRKTPGFIAFRDTTKFSLGISFIISLILALIFSSNYIKIHLLNYYHKIIVSLIFIVILTINIHPYQAINNYDIPYNYAYTKHLSTFKTHTLIEEYQLIKEYFSEKESPQGIIFFPGDPYYTFINNNLCGINSPESNRPWPFLKEIYTWRLPHIPEFENEGYILNENVQGVGNLSSLIGINYIYILPEKDHWWLTSKDDPELLHNLINPIIHQNDFEKILIDKKYPIYKNIYNPERFSVKRSRQIQFINSTDKLFEENEKNTLLNNYIWYLNDKKDKFNIVNKDQKHEAKVTIIEQNKSHVKLQLINAQQGDVLDFKQRFNPYWKLKHNNIENYSIETAYQTNSFIIPSDGTFEIDLIFEPQKYVTIGFYIWLVSWIFLISTATYLSVKQNKK
jgi:hypothetical protein